MVVKTHEGETKEVLLFDTPTKVVGVSIDQMVIKPAVHMKGIIGSMTEGDRRAFNAKVASSFFY